MGQKINPIIFRLNQNYEQKTKYFEKKSNELPLYSYKNLEVYQFIKKFFDSNGLTVHDIKLCHFNNILKIYISYFSSTKTTFFITDILKKQKIKISRKKCNKKKYLKIKYSIQKYFKYKELKYIKNLKNLKEKHIVNKEKLELRLRRTRFLKYYKAHLLSKKYKNSSIFKQNSFFSKFFESLSLFTNNKVNISLTLKPLNPCVKETISQQNFKIIKKNVVKLRKYEQNKFFKEGINILFLSVTNKNSAKLLSNFISNQLQKLKRHNFFLRFIKNTLLLFNIKKISQIEGIKIKVKGRFNRAPRARHKIIQIGKGVPALSINSKIDFGESTAFTSNGTFGIKVWICEKI